MTVIAFPPKIDGEANGWTAEELNQFESFYAARAHSGEVSDWSVATTAYGDPQFFLFGPAPASDCVLSISRLSGRYVMEDGNGGLIAETASLEELMHSASRLRLSRRLTGLVARVALAWAAVRGFVEEKVEPLVGEIAEVAELLHVAAFA